MIPLIELRTNREDLCLLDDHFIGTEATPPRLRTLSEPVAARDDGLGIARLWDNLKSSIRAPLHPIWHLLQGMPSRRSWRILLGALDTPYPTLDVVCKRLEERYAGDDDAQIHGKLGCNRRTEIIKRMISRTRCICDVDQA